MLLQQGQNGGPALASAAPADSSADPVEEIQQRLKSNWTIHTTTDHRLYYCNHLTQTTSWIPPVESWLGAFPYGWEEAFDHDGKPYFINHLNKTTTYEDPRKDWSEEPPVPREVSLTRHPEVGFGFVAGSEKPVIVRFVTEGGPSVDLLQPGDQILSVNGEDVKKAPRDHVIKLVRACKDVVRLTVCQPPLDNSARKSALLSAAKKAKLKSNPSRVRFAEGVVVNGSPLFPPSTFSNGEPSIPVLPNVLKVYLENGQTKSFKYDSNTTVRDVVTSLLQKLCIRSSEHFSLVVEHFKSLRRNKLTLLDPNESVARIAARPGSHNLRCLFRVTFVPKEAAELAQKDKVAFEYLYMQCCNDVVQERYAPELKYDLALRLAALHIHQHALAHNLAGKLTVKAVEREFGLERFIPVSLMGTMKRKELRKLLAHFLKLNQNILPGQKSLTSFQAKLHYLNIVGELPSYGAKCFSTNIRDGNMETVLLVSPKFGISQILGIRNSAPIALASIEDMRGIVVRREDELSRMVRIFLKNRELAFSLEDRDAEELVLVLQGYYQLFTGEELAMDEERDPYPEDCAPLYFSPHVVRPAAWSYADLSDDRSKLVNFSVMPQYQPHTAQTKLKMNGHVPVSKDPSIPNGTKCGIDNNMNIKSNPGSTGMGNCLLENGKCGNGEQFRDLGFDFHAMVSMEMMSDNSSAVDKTEEAMKRVAEMQELVMTSEQYLSEQGMGTREPSANPRGRPLVRLQEEEDSDCSHLSSELPYPGQLKHSDSLLLLAQIQSSAEELEDVVKNLDIGEVEPSESDTDSASTPAGSPSHKVQVNEANRLSSQSFGLHSPDGLSPTSCDIQDYLQRLKDDSNIAFEFSEGTLYLDPDIIDLTNIPPPATPDDGVNSLPVQPSLPPMPFADEDIPQQPEPAIYWGEEDPDSLTITSQPVPDADDLEAFLATVTVAPPAPAQEITPEEILSYIIPPPPKVGSPVYTAALDHMLNGETVQRTNSEAEQRLSSGGPFSPSLSRRGSSLRYPTGSGDARLPPRPGACETSARPPKAVQVSEWPKTSGPLKLSLYNGGGYGVGENLYYGTLPKSLPRNGDACNAIDHSYRTLPKNTLNGGGIDLGASGTLNKIISARNPVATSSPRDSSALSNSSPRNGVVSFKTCNDVGHWSPQKDGSVRHAVDRQTWNNQPPRREDFLSRSDDALAVLLVKLDQLAAQCDRAQYQGGGHHINQERFQAAKDAVSEEACELVTASKNLVKRLTSQATDAELADGCSTCLQHLRRLSERCTEMAAHTSAPLHTRNIILRVHDVASACRDVLRKPTTQQSEHLANVLTSLLRSLRLFE